MDAFPPASRRTDPDTSHKAEQRHTVLGKRAERARQVLRLIADYPGCTAGELARHMLRNHPELSITVCAETPHKRAPELLDNGLVSKGYDRKCFDSGYERATWYILDAGRQELEPEGVEA